MSKIETVEEIVNDIRSRHLECRRHIYAEIAADMDDCIKTIRTIHSNPDSEEPSEAATLLHNLLDQCLTVKSLDELTAGYRNESRDNCIGYDSRAVTEFVNKMVVSYVLDGE